MGQDQVAAIAHWCKLRHSEIKEWFGLKLKPLPHYVTWLRILGEAFDVQELQELVKEFLLGMEGESGLIPERGSVMVTIDGKSLRGTIPFGKKQGIHLVAAYQPQEGIVLAQLAVEAKGNEITLAPKVLAQIELEGRVVVGDAMFAQKSLNVQIVGSSGDYVWIIKGNQQGVLEDIEILFEETEPVPAGCAATVPDFERYRQVDKAHGRLEERTITISR